jgi:hypothetical protein
VAQNDSGRGSAAAQPSPGILSNCSDAFDSPINTRPEQSLQAPRAAAVIPAAHRFRRPPSRHALYAVRIAARREGSPHGQTRPFRLNDHDIEELVELARRLESGSAAL